MIVRIDRAINSIESSNNFSNIISNNGGIFEDIVQLYRKYNINNRDLLLIISDNDTLIPVIDGTKKLQELGGYICTNAINTTTDELNDVIFINVSEEFNANFIEYITYALGEKLAEQYSKYIIGNENDVNSFEHKMINAFSVFAALKLVQQVDSGIADKMLNHWYHITDLFECIVNHTEPMKDYEVYMIRCFGAFASLKLSFGFETGSTDKMAIALFNNIFGLYNFTLKLLYDILDKQKIEDNDKLNWVIQLKQINVMLSSFRTSEV